LAYGAVQFDSDVWKFWRKLLSPTSYSSSLNMEARSFFMQKVCRRTDGKRILGRPIHRWYGNIKMYVKYITYGFMSRINLI
jgi:hypothetical protein